MSRQHAPLTAPRLPLHVLGDLPAHGQADAEAGFRGVVGFILPIEALEEAGYRPGTDVKIMSVDGTGEALKLVRKGKISCVSECNPLLGPVLMKAVTDLLSGEELPLTIVSNETVFTGDTPQSQFKGRKY